MVVTDRGQVISLPQTGGYCHAMTANAGAPSGPVTRVTTNFIGRQGVHLNGSMAYTWRGNVTLDRSSYYTNGQLYLRNQVAMPDLFNHILSAGYRKGDFMITGDFVQQQSRGGGDIRHGELRQG